MKLDIYDRSGRMKREQWEMWFLYLLRTSPVAGMHFVKAGISSEPLTRICTVEVGCPLKIETAIFTSAGGVGVTRKLEARVIDLFSQRRTRGEWGLIQPEEWPNIVAGTELLYAGMSGRAPRWREIGPEEISAAMAATRALEEKRRHRVA
jgi:hypothetical protein